MRVELLPRRFRPTTRTRSARHTLVQAHVTLRQSNPSAAGAMYQVLRHLSSLAPVACDNHLLEADRARHVAALANVGEVDLRREHQGLQAYSTRTHARISTWRPSARLLTLLCASVCIPAGMSTDAKYVNKGRAKGQRPVAHSCGW